MEPTHLWCYACNRLDTNGCCARCGNPALEAVVDVMDAGAFLGSCHPDAASRSSEQLATVTVRDAGRDCAVCMEDLAPESEALVTPCGHAYHPGCVAPWLEDRGTCPLCRTHVGGRDGLVLCHFDGGRLGLGRRVVGRVFNIRVFDADWNLERPRAPRGLKRMLRISVRAMFRRDPFFRRSLQREFIS